MVPIDLIEVETAWPKETLISTEFAPMGPESAETPYPGPLGQELGLGLKPLKVLVGLGLGQNAFVY